MSNKGSEWTGSWVSQKLLSHTHVRNVRLIAAQHLEVERKNYPPVVIGTVAEQRVDAQAVAPFTLFAPPIAFLTNVPRESYVTGDALLIAEQYGFAVGGLADLLSALTEPSPGRHVSKERAFVERGLAQHTKVTAYTRLDDRRYKVDRRGLNCVIVVFLNEYELTADHVRTARARYGNFDMLVRTNPNGGTTVEAHESAKQLGCQIHAWAGFLGALNKR